MKKAAYLGCVRGTQTLYAKEYATMPDATTDPIRLPSPDPSGTPHDALTEVLRRGALRLLVQAVEDEAAAWIDGRATLTDAAGRRQVVRNGHADPRTILTGVGPLSIAMPRV